MNSSTDDEKWMQMALDLAARALGQTRPNPAVGSVVVKNGKAVGRGYHAAAGRAHAEVVALDRAGAAARGATLYVNLEPCCHHGRTPPCVDRIIEAGVRRVVVAICDPHERGGGRGIRRLRRAGVKVDVGVLAHEAGHLNQPFITYHRLGRPFFVAKWALTLDGQYRALSGDSKWITNEKSRGYVHELRARYDAILVGIGTVLSDNPRLNVRLAKRRNVIQPIRIIVDGYLHTPLKAHCINRKIGGATIIATTRTAPKRRVEQLRDMGVTVFVLPGRKGIVNLTALADALHAHDVQSVLVEGGQQMLSSMFAADLIDRVVAFFAPRIVGSEARRDVLSGWGTHFMKDAVSLHDIRIRKFETDVCVEGYTRHVETAPCKGKRKKEKGK